MKIHFTFLFAALLTAGAVVAQNTPGISGTVRDEKNLILPGATVFLTGTKSITVCNDKGEFQLNNVSPGHCQIVVKMVGFLPCIKAVTLLNQPVVLNIQLKPDNFLLKEVKVHPDYDREKHLALFKEEFLGRTYNAAQCKLLNPDVLYFNYDKTSKILTATANEILVVQNNALGYKIKYVLTDFQYEEKTRIVSYQGYPSFEEMPGTPKQEALWAKNRKIAYLGSITHFISCIYNNRVYQEGFRVYKLQNRPMNGHSAGDRGQTNAAGGRTDNFR